MRRVTRGCDLGHFLLGWHKMASRVSAEPLPAGKAAPIVRYELSPTSFNGTLCARQEMVHVTHVADVHHRILCCELLSFGRIPSTLGP